MTMPIKNRRENTVRMRRILPYRFCMGDRIVSGAVQPPREGKIAHFGCDFGCRFQSRGWRHVPAHPRRNALKHGTPGMFPIAIIGNRMEINWFPLWLSLRVALLATAFSLAVGVWIAYLLANRQFRGKELVDAAVTLPLVLPPTVLGYYLLVLLSRESVLGRLFESLTGGPLVFTWKAAVLAAMVHSTPLLVKLVRAALETVDRTYEKAARNLGANEWRVFWRVSLPLARRPVFAAAVLAFARSLGDFGITIMLAGNIPNRTQTVSVAIYDAVEAGNETTALVLVLAISAIALVSVYVANRWNEGKALR